MKSGMNFAVKILLYICLIVGFIALFGRVEIGLLCIITSIVGLHFCELSENISYLGMYLIDKNDNITRIDDNLFELTRLMEMTYPEAYKEYQKELRASKRKTTADDPEDDADWGNAPLPTYSSNGVSNDQYR